MIDLIILTVCQLVKGYSMLRGQKITYIARLYLRLAFLVFKSF